MDEIDLKDDLTLKLGDTLDVKASILLAAIALLATQTAYFLDKQTSRLTHDLLIFAALSLGAAMVCAFVELCPRRYMMPAPDSSGVSRAGELRDFYSQHADVGADVMFDEFTKNEIEWAQKRIAANRRINRIKSFCLEYSFYFTAVAMTLNIATLFMRLF
jgi:hypothetical protein